MYQVVIVQVNDMYILERWTKEFCCSQLLVQPDNMSVFNAENVFENTCSESLFIFSTYTPNVQETKMEDNELGTHEPDHQEENFKSKSITTENRIVYRNKSYHVLFIATIRS